MEGIIFDVDGTLWDSTEVVAVSWNQAIREHTNLEVKVTAEELRKLFGRPLEEIMDCLFPQMELKKKQELATYCYKYENALVETEPCIIYEGMEEGIRKLAKTYPLFIVSNCQEGYIEAFLKNTRLEAYIQDFTCPGDTGKLKADNIKIIMKRNGIKDAVYVGDTQGDEEACKLANIPMIYAEYGFGKVKEEHTTIQSFSELLTIDFSEIMKKNFYDPK
ncbi:HAD family hydrolase [Lachnospiraceae bacterium LCP25S3_G4]